MIRRLYRRGKDWAKDAGGYLVERPVRLVVVLAAFVGGGVAGYPIGDAGYDYGWKDPTFCSNCHVHDYADEAFARSVHAGVTTCHDCHKVPLTHLMAEGMLMVTDRPQTPEDISPTSLRSVVCEACHVAGNHEHLTGPMNDEMRAMVVKVDQSPLHRLHLEATSRDPGTYLGANHGAPGADEHDEHDEHDAPAKPLFAPETAGGHGREAVEGIVCLDCHGSGGNTAAHRFTADRQNCLECHGGIDVAVGRLAELRCQECHFSGFIGVRPGDDVPR